MSRLTPRRAPRPDIEVAVGERLLAWAATEGGHVGGTRDALYLPQIAEPTSAVEPVETRIPWEHVQAADWDPETSIFRVAEVGVWGESRPVHSVMITETGRLLELVRERVTASILLQRHVPIAQRRGVRLIARRAPGRPALVNWIFEYDEGVDPNDPVVRLAAEDALARAREELGLR